MMRRSSSIESPVASQGLHPALQAALNGLEVELEAELAHYRRQRDRRPGQAKRTYPSQTKPANTLAIGAAGATLPLESSTPVAIGSEATPPHPEIYAAASTPDPWAALAVSEPVEQERSFEPGSSLATLHPDLTTGNDLAEPEIEHPDDYLESSEELLKSLAEEEADLRAKQEPGMLETLLTPLGIGSILLLLLSSLTFGYLIMNPSSLRVLGLDRLINGSSSPETPQPSPEADPNQSSAIPTSPNLANQEFVDLNLNTLSTLPVRPTAVVPAPSVSPTVSPAAPVSAQPLAARSAPSTVPAPSSTSTLPSVPVPRQSYRSAPAPVSPQPESAPVRPRTQSAPPVRSVAPARVEPQPVTPAPSVAAAPSSPTSAQPRYRVVINYSGDASLNQVREVVPEAYVRNSQEGAQVQAGNFSDEENARQLVQQLEQQGISAEISRP